MNTRAQPHNLFRDISIVLLSIVLAIVVAHTGIIGNIIASGGGTLISSFVAGLFFTSVFTVSLATVALVEIAKTNSVGFVALWGACGALLGDLIIFRFVKYDLSEDLAYIIRKAHADRWISLFHIRIFRFLMPLFGAVIIASPLPDEIGVALMGLSGLRMRYFVPLSFCFNFFGIIVLSFVSKLFF